jgi:hypothetical protein
MKMAASLLSALAAVLCGLEASAHPSSGIVVDDRGDVIFVHSGKGVAKIDASGKLSYIHNSRGGHWMCLDPNGSFSRTQPKFFERITPEGVTPAIIFADGGAPVAVGHDGNLYFGSNWHGGGEHDPGGLTVSRVSPAGAIAHVSVELKDMLAKQEEGVTGLAAGPDGFIYVASPSSIFKLGTNGSVSRVARPGAVAGCDKDLPPEWQAPGFRGLDVQKDGSVLAAAPGCRCVVKITASGGVTSVLKSERPWNPTGVAAHGEDIYVLEWTNANGGPADGWRPRVRKLTPDGRVTTIVEIKEELPR